MLRIRAMSGLCAVVLGLAACGDATSSGDPLTEAEAAELAAVFAEEGFAGFGTAASQGQQAPGSDEAATVRITQTISGTESCEGSGTVAFSGTLVIDVNDQTGTGTIEFNYTIAPANCRVTTESNKVFTLSGDPNIKGTGQFNITQTGFNGSLTYEGRFRWEAADGRAGACAVNLQSTYNFTTSGTTVNGTATLSGEVCGHSISRSITLQDV